MGMKERVSRKSVMLISGGFSDTLSRNHLPANTVSI